MSTMDEDRLREHANAYYYQQALGPRPESYLALFEKFEHAGERWVANCKLNYCCCERGI